MGKGGRNSSLTAHPGSWVAGAGERDGAGRRGAHEDQPQRLSPSAETRGIGNSAEPVNRSSVTPANHGPSTSCVVPASRAGPQRFVDPKTGHARPKAALLLSKPPQNDFGKSRSFNHIFILLEIMSLDNLYFGVLRLFFSFLIK